MRTELYEKLQQLKAVMRQLDLERRLAIVERVRSQLPPEALTTRDGQHTFSAENLLVMALVTPHAANKDDLSSTCGLYQGGYQSELRRCVYHNSAGAPQWKTKINRLYHLVKEHITEHVTVTLPQLREEEKEYVPADAWKVTKF